MKPEWIDVSHAPDGEPYCFNLSMPYLTIVVERAAQGGWNMQATDVGLEDVYLGAVGLDDAQERAIAIVRRRVLRLAGSIAAAGDG